MLNHEDVRQFNIRQKKNTFFATCIITAIIMFVLIYVFLMPSRVTGTSMCPTLEDGDIVFSISPKMKQYKPGDIVLINSVSVGKNIIKRVIATGGDVVEFRESRVYVNGSCLQEDYIKQPSGYENMTVEVPKGYIFVLGDNRDNSNDSRYFGCISEAEIHGIYLFHIR